MADTIFHQIADGHVPAYTIKESDSHMAFLDIYPSQKGQVVVIPKRHTTSHFSRADSTLLKSTVEFAQHVAALMERKLPGVERVLVLVEGLEIDYLHIKLIPTYSDSGLVKAGRKASQDDLARLHKLLTT